MPETPSFKGVSDDVLLRRLSDLVGRSRGVEADLVAHIAEVDERRLYRREASSSMYAYCVEVLHLAEPVAWLRIRVARASRRFPVLLEMLRDGRIHLSGIALLVPHLTAENHRGLLKRATHKSKRQIEEIVAEVAPRPDAVAGMRKLPAPRQPQSQAAAAVSDLPLRPDAVEVRSGNLVAPRSELRPDAAPASSRTAAARPAAVEPLAPARYKVQFTASQELHDKLERLQALMRSSVSAADLAAVIDAAVTRELERLEKRRFAKTRTPRQEVGEADTRPKSRHIPAAVRRAVEKRDGGRCVYRDKRGRRCSRRHDLEFHHRVPFGQGGHHTPQNLALMCRAHNGLLAETDYGKEVMGRYRRSGRAPLRNPGVAQAP